jgi:hypothetical protein
MNLKEYPDASAVYNRATASSTNWSKRRWEVAEWLQTPVDKQPTARVVARGIKSVLDDLA